MSRRFKAPNKVIYEYNDKVYVKCPRCKDCAVLNRKNNMDVVTCTKCGFLSEKGFQYSFELWLKVKCCGKTLWALNEEHLDYLESFVKATLREQSKDEYGWHNQSIASRLPKWIQDSKNRDDVLKGIAKLRKKLL